MSTYDLDAADVAALARLPLCACGNAAFAFAAGDAPEYEPGAVRFPDGRQMLLRPGRDAQGWCVECWLPRTRCNDASRVPGEVAE